MRRRELNDRFKAHIAKSRRVRVMAASLLCVCLLAGSGAALHHRLPDGARLWTALAGNALVLGLALRMALSA